MKIKSTIWLLSMLLLACNKQNKDDSESIDTTAVNDTVQITKSIAPEEEMVTASSNERFRQVTVEKVGENKFRLQGQAQVWEANISWVIEDGHNELKSGFTTADAGAPEWGNFDFTIEIEKKDNYSTLILILFEESAEDGSRKHELPIPLK
ncbi:sporulation protein [Flavobacterium sp. XN-5]|uniref:Gmad2 immunoglobulin-like domain-containing protein n=1 Tax=Flavobacterium sp. XN-5 TaxID=2599390 RepID=UPI0011CA1E39|nr:Gmad2 immunoglobulin-like domain-containing protein [Flavobacterium sp. XN-5]NGY37082.1 sporulation protein [Flavobacterium sp. XN-5]